jgi:hypothetical protein
MKTLAALLACAALLDARRAEACAGCSNPNLPGGRGGVAALAPGEVSAAVHLVGTRMRVVHESRCPDIGPICNARAEPPQLHDQLFYSAELRAIVGVGVHEAFGLEVQVPVRYLQTSIQLRRLDGTPFVPDYENIHHRDETLAGVGDPWLLGRASWSLGRLAIASRAGVGLPVGRTEEDPFARGRAGFAHQHVQFGTGTFHPVLAVDGAWSFEAVRLLAYAQSVLFLYENAQRYQAGDRHLGGLTLEGEPFRALRVGLGTDLLHEQAERWAGVVQQDGNVGRTDLLVGGSVSYASGSVVTSLAVKVPVWQRFAEAGHAEGDDPGQLTYPAIVALSVATSFGAPPPQPKSGVLP